MSITLTGNRLIEGAVQQLERLVKEIILVGQVKQSLSSLRVDVV